MTALLIAFLGAAALLWLSVFGYLLTLGLIALARRTHCAPLSSYPDVAVVVPTLNEEALIAQKLHDLQQIDYPRDRLTVVVVDGGSTDRTTALVEQEIARGAAVQLLTLDHTQGKADQMNQALRRVTQEIVVFTDADALLEPSCVRELVGTLAHDPDTAVVGATIYPASTLLEERIHWWFLNTLWWLEGEVLSAAMISGVCYAVRRATVLKLALDARADDAHIALSTGARGFRVRTCRTAIATEVRVPQTAQELVRFRRKRGTGYVRELLRIIPRAEAPVSWRVARHVRIWHFLVTPKAVVALAIAAATLLCTPHWRWPLIALVAFAAPVLAALYTSTTLGKSCQQWWRLTLAAAHLLGLTWLSLMVMSRSAPSDPSPGDGS